MEGVLSFSSSGSMQDTINAIRTVANTDRISTDDVKKTATVRLPSREADLTDWIVKELANPNPGERGHQYTMPNDHDDAIVILSGIRVGAPIASMAAHPATAQELEEIVTAIRLLGDVQRIATCKSDTTLLWRGRAWQTQLIIWLLRQFGEPPATDWIDSPVKARWRHCSTYSGCPAMAWIGVPNQESYLDSCGPFRDVVISLMATLAKQERLRVSERTKAGLQRARRAGKVLGRPRVEVDVQKLRRLQESGLSLRQIAAKAKLSLSTVARSLAA